MLPGSSHMMPTGWRRILRRFLATQFPQTHSVICSTVAPAKFQHFCVSSRRPDTSSSFAWRNYKNFILRGNSLTEWDCVTILSCVKEIHPAKAAPSVDEGSLN